VSFAAITLYVASQIVFIVVSVYFVIDSVPKLFDTLPYICNRTGRVVWGTHSYLVVLNWKFERADKYSSC
jgi:hypothetical protein